MKLSIYAVAFIMLVASGVDAGPTKCAKDFLACRKSCRNGKPNSSTKAACIKKCKGKKNSCNNKRK